MLTKLKMEFLEDTHLIRGIIESSVEEYTSYDGLSCSRIWINVHDDNFAMCKKPRKWSQDYEQPNYFYRAVDGRNYSSW